MNNPNSYKTEYTSDVLGESLRPGISKLTQKAIEFCNITSKDKILDIGCGKGTTISYLYNKYNVRAAGIDTSEKLVNIAKENCNFAEFENVSGAGLPFANESFDCVIAENTLSLVDDLNARIQEVNRVLKKDGWFVVVDVYIKNPSTLPQLEGYLPDSKIKGLHDLEELQQKIKSMGFKNIYLGDYSDLEKTIFPELGYFILIALRGDDHESG